MEVGRTFHSYLINVEIVRLPHFVKALRDVRLICLLLIIIFDPSAGPFSARTFCTPTLQELSHPLVHLNRDSQVEARESVFSELVHLLWILLQDVVHDREFASLACEMEGQAPSTISVRVQRFRKPDLLWCCGLHTCFRHQLERFQGIECVENWGSSILVLRS